MVMISICPRIHVCGAERVDRTESVEGVPIEIDPMGGDCFRERIGQADLPGNRDRVRSIIRVQRAERRFDVIDLESDFTGDVPQSGGRLAMIAIELQDRAPYEIVICIEPVRPLVQQSGALQPDGRQELPSPSASSLPTNQGERPQAESLPPALIAHAHRFSWFALHMNAIALARTAGQLLDILVERLRREFQPLDGREVGEDRL